MVRITDMNGFELEVTDLDGALEQSELMKEFRHAPPKIMDEVSHRYWLDLYSKLLDLKANRHEQSSR